MKDLSFPISETIYEHFIDDVFFARTTIDQYYAESPELFSHQFDEGYIFNGLTTPSVKQGYQCFDYRNVEIKRNGYNRLSSFLSEIPILPTNNFYKN